MADFVKVHDVHSSSDTVDENMLDNEYKELRNLKQQMGRTWSDLTRIMTTYQGQLISKHKRFEVDIVNYQAGRYAKQEKQIHVLEQKVLEKDSEIVRLRTEVHKLCMDISIKDGLIDKLQNQFAKEAIDYHAEIDSLKELLKQQKEYVDIDVNPKRRRLNLKSDEAALSWLDQQSESQSHLMDQLHSEAGPSASSSVVLPSVAPQSASNDVRSANIPQQSSAGSETSAGTSRVVYVKLEAPDEPCVDEFIEDGAEAFKDYYEDIDSQLHLSDVHSHLQKQPQNGPALPGGIPVSDSESFNSFANPLDSTTPWSRQRTKCPVCLKVIFNQEMSAHKRRHVELCPFQCTLCAKTFADAPSGWKHVRYKHKKDEIELFITRLPTPEAYSDDGSFLVS